MATITPVDIGAAPDDGNGDPLRTAFSKINNNETNLNTDKLEAPVALTSLADIATDSFLGRNTAGTGAPEVLSAAIARAILNVEDGSTADQTNGEIKTAYEANANTNAFTDAEQTKLAGIATGAIANVVEDTTPQLGGDLDINSQSLVTTGNADLLLEPNGSGAVSVSGVTDYENNVTVDDDIPNKKFCDDTYLKQTESFTIALSDQTTALTTGTGKSNFFMPYAFTLTEVRANVATAPTGSVLTVDINEGGVTILSTKITIDVSEKTSTTAATAPVISDSLLADDAELTFDIDTIGSTIAGAGLKVTLIGTRT